MKRNIILLLASAVLFSCSRGYIQFINQYNFRSSDGLPDYSNLDYWAAHPYKKDPSDSLPKSLSKKYQPDSTADVFFLYPTSYTDAAMPYGYNAPLDNAEINAKTDYGSILYQASIFNNAGRIFSPRYRQANYWCYFPKDSAAAIAAFKLAYEDIKAAFEYYLDHYNNGKPIIIASHSQGTTHGILLLKDYFDNKPLQKQLVVAYLAGMPVHENDFTKIKPCTTPGETGCFCSWRTMKSGFIPPYVQNEKIKAVVSNTLSWDTSLVSVSRKNNKGSVLRKFSKLKSKVAGATVHEGVLWTKRPHFFGSIFLPIKNYHVADYNFYYSSIRENVRLRLDNFLKK